jgi:hypothetical protein
MNYSITYSNGFTSCRRGPFSDIGEALQTFQTAPVMPGETAYLEDSLGNVLDKYSEPDEA